METFFNLPPLACLSKALTKLTVAVLMHISITCRMLKIIIFLVVSKRIVQHML